MIDESARQLFSMEHARRYARRRRAVLVVIVALLVGVIGWRTSIVLGRNELRAVCERQRSSTELFVDVERRFAGLVQVQAHQWPEPVLPARGDVIIGAHGSYLVGDGRVLALDRSCAKAIP